MDGRKPGNGRRRHPQDGLAERFETQRGQLRAVAYRMLGSLSEADDAVQETWLRLSRADAEAVGNLTGWLRTVLSRICLDMLRSRTARREEPVGQELPELARETGDGGGPEDEAVLADSVGRALLVVLDTLGPAERIAFVLHDVFAVPFDRIAPIVERSPVAAKKLASRARQKVRGSAAVPRAELDRQRRTVDAFLAAARGGDMAALLAVLDPDVVRRADRAALPEGVPTVARGARAVAEETAGFAPRARFAEPALVNGSVGVVVAPRGRLLLALTVTVQDGRIAAYEVIADPVRLSRLELGLLDDVRPPVASDHG
ncbi:sigma-70 family RNA polymerase sigma factor [Streptomyces rugosispiralis]|uniref:Sigma-70 family RNA polymerase sigma factor n=1 Tax=Streptomyces rugosispiralis TaxID=2967341 RepID=A0ABT1UQW4_9ACTN|nr:sigma-70 family RNA polymerase sigma factor [Streptomyces rugosispiralis]MCQ8187386.1 sigma-70 family RNA polymerase sigma factor [Streptomyces rugosispiralis]